MKTTTVSILRSQLKSYIAGVINTNEPVLINKGSDGAVLISLKEYNTLLSRASSDDRIPKSLPDNFSIPKNDYYVDVNVDEL